MTVNRKPNDSGVVFRLHVRYAETDQMQVAYYGRYFEWFEAARSAFCRERGIPYSMLEREHDLMLPVAEACCRYKAPARYDDEIAIHAFVSARTRRTLRFGYTVMRGETLLAEGETAHVLVGRDGRPRSFPPEVAARLDGFEGDGANPCAAPGNGGES